jgi:hypothetical protein
VRGRVCFTLNNYRNFTSISNEINWRKKAPKIILEDFYMF